MANLQVIQVALQANAQAVQALQVQGAGGPGFAYEAAKALKPDVKLFIESDMGAFFTETGYNLSNSVRGKESTCCFARSVMVRPRGM